MVRTQMPDLGSQLACNVMRSVSSMYQSWISNHPKFSTDKKMVLPKHQLQESHCSPGQEHHSLLQQLHRSFGLYDEWACHCSSSSGKVSAEPLAGFMAEELAGTSKENRIFKPGECNLVWKCGIKGAPSRWELHIAIEKKLKEVSLDNLSLNQVMGVDVGENNAAALSTGRIFKAGKMKDDRDKYLSSRARFQRNGSRSARQALRKASGREKRHVEQINDEISKSIIEDAAERNIRLIVPEDLTDIRQANQGRAEGSRTPAPPALQGASAKKSGQSLSSGYRSDLRGSSLYVENLSALQCHRNTAQAPICLQELWLQSAQQPQCWSESATSGLSADNSGTGVNKPYVEPALAGDNKAFDFSRELFTKAKRGLVLAHGGFGADIPYRTIFDPKLTAEIGTTCQPGATSEA